MRFLHAFIHTRSSKSECIVHLQNISASTGHAASTQQPHVAATVDGQMSMGALHEV